MSKHAVEAYTDVLATELAPFGVQVSIVEPGNYKSRISESRRKRLAEAGFDSEGSLYKEQLDRMLEGPADRSEYKDPTEVAEAFLHAMTAEQPKRRYMVVPNEREAGFTVRAAMQRVVELNGDQPYELDREELIAMLDELLSES